MKNLTLKQNRKKCCIMTNPKPKHRTMKKKLKKNNTNQVRRMKEVSGKKMKTWTRVSISNKLKKKR